MLLIWLPVILTCLTLANSYDKSRNSNDAEKSDNYNKLLSALYQRYKFHTEDHVSNDDVNVARHKAKFISSLSDEKRRLLSIIGDVNLAQKRLEDIGKTQSGEERGAVVQPHAVTPIHDDDISKDEMREDSASKRDLLPQMDMISPILDDVSSALSAVISSTETATQKNKVSVHDDNDDHAGTHKSNSSTYKGCGEKKLSYTPVKSWPCDGDFLCKRKMPATVGQISGVAMLPNDTQLVVLHRADRYWDGSTFNWKNIVNKKYQKPIAHNTMIWMDRLTGNVRKSRGKNMFYLPHGITIDRKGFIWVTDVASHQVYKMTPDLKVVMTLGRKFLPGSDRKSFCKPTDVAVMPNGEFFVGDGYCNSRVLKFNKKGALLLVIAADTRPNIGLFPKPYFMSVVHSVAVDPIRKRLFVADRENGRVLVFRTTNGMFMRQIKAPQGAVYAVAYNSHRGGLLHFVTGPLSDRRVTLSGYTYSLRSGSVVSHWAPDGGFTLPHDLAVTKDNMDGFVVEINPFKVWKFTQKMKSPRK